MGEQRYRAVWEVLDGASVTEVARRFGVSRQSVHTWLRRYAADGGLGGLGDRSSRPHGCPHQMSPAVEAKIVEIRRAHPAWGADRIGYQLEQEGIVAVPGRNGTAASSGRAPIGHHERPPEPAPDQRCRSSSTARSPSEDQRVGSPCGIVGAAGQAVDLATELPQLRILPYDRPLSRSPDPDRTGSDIRSLVQ